MGYLICLMTGYLPGSISMAAILSRINKTDLRKRGTGNLGATNTFLTLGKGYGVLVMVFDIAKAFFAARLARALFPKIAIAGMLAGFGAILGHAFPFYMNFKGGKGLAAFAGMVLATDPAIFLVLLVITVILVLIVNYGVAMPMSAAVLFPAFVWLRTQSVPDFLVAALAGGLLAALHTGNVIKAYTGKDIKVREYIKTELFSKKKHTTE